MAYQDVKITDLEQVSSFLSDDLFLISHPNKNSVYTPYNSNSISGNAISESVGKRIAEMPLNITNHWSFNLPGSATNNLSNAQFLPTQDTLLGISAFLQGITDERQRESVRTLAENQWYYKLSTTVVEKVNPNGTVQSLSVNNSVIPNLDFVYRLTAGVVDMLLNGEFKTSKPKLNSYVGMIIHSTTLDTKEKVIAQYGGSEWVEHRAYFLRARGAEKHESVTRGIQNPPRGDLYIDISADTFNGFVSHKHSYDNLNRGEVAAGKGATVVVPEHGKSWGGTGDPVFGDGGGGTGSKGASGGGGFRKAFVPHYKPVYIWERMA